MDNTYYPIGIQSFEVLRKDDYLYVDKTELIYRLASTSRPYFLSRPRRFGKSLLISTLEAYFLGKKELFEGLAMAELEKDWTKHEVLRLDLSAELYDSKEALEKTLDDSLDRWEKDYQIADQPNTLSNRFANIIRTACEKSGHGVVVLIDEYDAPLLSVIHDNALLESYKQVLKAFYTVLKSSGQYLRFAMLTGVTQFSKVTVFSGLNQLLDISLSPDYNALCGITHGELLRNFTPGITELAEANGLTFDETVAKLERHYDGYHFCKQINEGIFNPFSLLNVFEHKSFDNYWFKSGTPTFLIDVLKRSKDYDLQQVIQGVEADSEHFNDYRAELDDPIPLFYQSGYLTIKSYDKEFDIYKLQFPNEEVEYSLLRYIIPYSLNSR